MVGAEGNDPSTPVLSGQCSTSELCANEMVGGDGFEPPVLPLRNGFTVRRRTTVSAAHLYTEVHVLPRIISKIATVLRNLRATLS